MHRCYLLRMRCSCLLSDVCVHECETPAYRGNLQMHFFRALHIAMRNEVSGTLSSDIRGLPAFGVTCLSTAALCCGVVHEAGEHVSTDLTFLQRLHACSELAVRSRLQDASGQSDTVTSATEIVCAFRDF